MLIYGDTDKGKIRANNQDSFAFNIVSNECAWAVVCDGMGGVNGGNVASKISVEVVFEALKRSYKNGAFNGAIKNIMQSAIVKANLAVFGQAKGNKELSGMGTTIVVVIIYNGIAYIAHAGDSRAYLINNSDIVQITRDHSIVQMMLEQGKITKEEAKYHPSKNIITRALGVSDVIDIEYNEIAFKCNDTILICTDGLTNCVEADNIKEIVLANKSSEVIAQLINAANAAGGTDNITSVVIFKEEDKVNLNG